MFRKGHRDQVTPDKLSAYNVWSVNYSVNDNVSTFTLYVHKNDKEDNQKNLKKLYDCLCLLKFDTNDGFTRETLPKELPVISEVVCDSKNNIAEVYFNRSEPKAAECLLRALYEDSIITKDQMEECLPKIGANKSPTLGS